MSTRSALVTGGAGFIGSHLVDRLVAEGISTTVFDDLSTGVRGNVNPGARFIQGTILDAGALGTAMAGADVVFHLAAQVTIRDSVRRLLQDAEINYLGTLNVVQSMLNSPARHLVFASTMGIYGDSCIALREDSVYGPPLCPYGISKLAAEHCCLLLARQHAFTCTVLRYFNTYGPRQLVSEHVGVIKVFVHKLLAGEPITIFGDGNHARDYIHVSDVVDLTVRAGIQRRTAIVNVGTGRGTTLNELCGILAERLGMKPQIAYLPANPLELRQAVADISRARDWFSFSPAVELHDGIDQLMASEARKADAAAS